LRVRRSFAAQAALPTRGGWRPCTDEPASCATRDLVHQQDEHPRVEGAALHTSRRQLPKDERAHVHCIRPTTTRQQPTPPCQLSSGDVFRPETASRVGSTGIPSHYFHSRETTLLLGNMVCRHVRQHAAMRDTHSTHSTHSMRGTHSVRSGRSRRAGAAGATRTRTSRVSRTRS